MRMRAARRMGDPAITHKANEKSALEHHCTSQEEDQMTLYKRKREVADEPYDHSEVQSLAVLERAKGVQANLAPEYPSFVKLMLRSHVTKGFSLVYIIRANGLAETDGALGLLNLDLGVKKIDFGKKEKVIRRCKKAEERHLRLPQPAANIQKSSMTIMHSDLGPASNQSENGAEELSSDGIEEFVLSSSLLGLENFKIIANVKMVARKAVYEECRRKRVEENKTRMEQLKLTKLVMDLRTTAANPNPSPRKKVKSRLPRQPLNLSAVRRSSRVADKPLPSYKEVPIEPMGRPRSGRIYQIECMPLTKTACAQERAEDNQIGLGSDFSSFVKPMLQSHVTGGFWLGLPISFCKTQLPKHDATLTLTDEEGDEWPTKYLPRKTGLSGGWKGFAVDHSLVDGDALVFQLISPTAFKVESSWARQSS
ncbi:hypothetical protein RJ639_042100 [Escallonia herrerae]|uniref:TF-B3 domain-containing protein n=1 Tax=Escallonia herrerae TaxID=1293975 RepID=A0AA88WDL0_9ASTE|nr:hypothetical protein RJ639_042100 [Escallonia herrerae]